MAAAKSRRRETPYRAGTPYVSGTAARKLAAVREPQSQLERPVRQEKTNRVSAVTIRRNREKALQMDLPYVIALTAAVVCALYLCVNYLQLQSSITAKLKNIETLEKEIETLKTNNDALETRIETSVDLDYVYQVATEELGMVYANKDQVRLYDKTESEYVKQYEDIPEQ